jgi:hypothetical protein
MSIFLFSYIYIYLYIYIYIYVYVYLSVTDIIYRYNPVYISVRRNTDLIMVWAFYLELDASSHGLKSLLISIYVCEYNYMYGEL